MNAQNHPTWSRREFLRGLTILGGAGLLGLRPELVAAEPPPETTTIRLTFDSEWPVLCFAPQYVAEQFLKIEGFTDVRYVSYGPEGSSTAKLFIDDEVDMTATLHVEWIVAVDNGEPVVVLSGLHAGCLELFANDRVHSIRELKGKRIGVEIMGGSVHLLLSSIVAYIGLDPKRDIKWVASNPSNWPRMLAEGEVDAILVWPPMSYDMRTRKIGHVILYTTTDEPWRHYFCCMVGARPEFVQNYPIATKRALRAILKANQLCSMEPDRTAQWLMDKGFASDYDYTMQTLQEVLYGAWQDYDPGDTLRFFSLRLREAGMIKSSPQEILARGTDWRFLNEIRRELKA